jgi:hypothetical protein
MPFYFQDDFPHRRVPISHHRRLYADEQKAQEFPAW